MKYALDLHTHTLHSDGYTTPEKLVESAKARNPDTKWLSLTDHNTFAGCEAFLAACRKSGIEGFVGTEISGSHEKYSHVEFHFLTYFGTAWTPSVAERTNHFTAYFNRLLETDTKNIFSFLEAAAGMGVRISFHEVVRKAVEGFLNLPEPRDYSLIKAAAFRDVRAVLKERELAGPQFGKTDFEKNVWKEAGIKPLPTPRISGAYAAFREARPAIILAHPMLYQIERSELETLIEEWQTEIGLIGLEGHYAGKFFPEYKKLADKFGMVTSVGSDTHSAYDGTKGATSVPEVDAQDIDVPGLLDVLRGAGK